MHVVFFSHEMDDRGNVAVHLLRVICWTQLQYLECHIDQVIIGAFTNMEMVIHQQVRLCHFESLPTSVPEPITSDGTNEKGQIPGSDMILARWIFVKEVEK